MFQARLVAQRIEAAGGPPIEIVVLTTAGDRLQHAPLSDIGGKRLFVKEIEDALLNDTIDLAVHSAKDMPAELPEGLDVGAVLEREDPRDALVLPVGKFQGSDPRDDQGGQTPSLPQGARIGTGSVRRIAQLSRLYPAAVFENVRGNVDTRLRKLDAGEYDLLVLAAAGLRRLGFSSRISATMPIEDCVPAPGQGIIAVEIRADDTASRAIVSRLNDEPAWTALQAERALVVALGGGCQMPIGGLAVTSGEALELHAVVASLDGARLISYKKAGTRAHAAELGRDVAAHLIAHGAASILDEARRSDASLPGAESLRQT
jgi:hydroxymethylbilane synthase